MEGHCNTIQGAIDSFCAQGILLGLNTRGESEYVMY